MAVLDLACGHGRIANRLAARGAEVAGLDVTPRFLELRQTHFEVRMFTYPELRDWLLEADFAAVAGTARTASR